MRSSQKMCWLISFKLITGQWPESFCEITETEIINWFALDWKAFIAPSSTHLHTLRLSEEASVKSALIEIEFGITSLHRKWKCRLVMSPNSCRKIGDDHCRVTLQTFMMKQILYPCFWRKLNRKLLTSLSSCEERAGLANWEVTSSFDADPWKLILTFAFKL